MNNMMNTKPDNKYDWLRDRDWPEVKSKDVLNFLNAHNKKAEDYFKSQDKLYHQLYNEICTTIVKKDSTVPIQIDGFLYWRFIEESDQYWTFVRRKIDEEKVQVLLNVNKLAANKPYCNVAKVFASPDHKLIAYAIDETGDERYNIVVIDEHGNVIDQSIENAFEDIAWDKDSKGLFYLPANEYWRADKLYYHQIKDDIANDTLLIHEQDSRFRISLSQSSSKELIFAYVSSADENAVYLVNNKQATLLLPCLEKRMIYINERHGVFYFLINDTGRNFRLCSADIETINNPTLWKELIKESSIYLEHFLTFDSAFALQTKEIGLSYFYIYNYTSDGLELKYKSAIDKEAYDLSIIFTSYNATALRFEYSALNLPSRVCEIDFTTYNINTLKEQKLPRQFNENDYTLKRIWAESSDGVSVPISLVYKTDLFKGDGQNPLYLYGYGSYGLAVHPRFRGSILSLLDRGFVYAIAHIRGGDDLGYDWYESAKLMNKKRTFIDFVNCAKYLIENGYTYKKGITIMGGSAGGMLVGAALNMAPELFHAVVAHVPFVDVLATMLDDTLPLTPLEYQQWGNPNKKEVYDYIASYSPVDNLKAIDYPHIFATAGISDPRVTYWEPAKWVAKIEDLRTNNNLLLLKTNMSFGHGGASGRFDSIAELAEEFAFVISSFHASDAISNSDNSDNSCPKLM